MSKYLNVNKDDIVFVENASDGFNAAIKSFKWEKKDKILKTNLAYPMVNLFFIIPIKVTSQIKLIIIFINHMTY